MRLDEVAADTRVMFPYCGKIALVVSHGQMGTRIKYENDARTIEIAADEFTGREARTFTVPGKVEIVSGGSEVLLCPKEASSLVTRVSFVGGSRTPKPSKSSARSKRKVKMKR
jgi:hypothetical protein